ncbi:glycosyltransferase, partial [Salmonella enterica subsp. enterica serovar Typhi]|nr:glycosyltransferase [Salmonella enterica subsp. enterica serovar Typhi]
MSRVLVVSLFHPDIVRGGAQRVAYDLFLGLREAGHDAYFLGTVMPENAPALYKSGAWITGFNGQVNEFILLQRDYDYFWHRAKDASSIERIADFLTKLAPDTVHLHHFFTFGMEIIPLIRRVLPEARIILTLHEFLAICYADGQMRKRGSKALCNRASPWDCHRCFPEIGPELFFLKSRYFHEIFEVIDAFIAPTAFVRERYVEWGLPESKIAVVSNPDTGERKRLPMPYARNMQGPDRTHINFAFLGQLVDNKGVDVIIRAARVLVGRGVTGFSVSIHGGNEQYASEDMRALMAEAKIDTDLSKFIAFKGEYVERDLEAIMAAADVVIVPSTWWEIFCLVVTEAWRFGRPVICSEIGGLKERVKDGFGGLTFKVGDHQALAERM